MKIQLLGNAFFKTALCSGTLVASYFCYDPDFTKIWNNKKDPQTMIIYGVGIDGKQKIANISTTKKEKDSKYNCSVHGASETQEYVLCSVTEVIQSNVNSQIIDFSDLTEKANTQQEEIKIDKIYKITMDERIDSWQNENIEIITNDKKHQIGMVKTIFATDKQNLLIHETKYVLGYINNFKTPRRTKTSSYNENNLENTNKTCLIDNKPYKCNIYKPKNDTNQISKPNEYKTINFEVTKENSLTNSNDEVKINNYCLLEFIDINVNLTELNDLIYSHNWSDHPISHVKLAAYEESIKKIFVF